MKETKGIFIRMTEAERKKWKKKCVTKGLSYKESIFDWVNR